MALLTPLQMLVLLRPAFATGRERREGNQAERVFAQSCSPFKLPLIYLRSSVQDKSNGYEAIAEHFSRARTVSIGPRVVRAWAKALPDVATEYRSRKHCFKTGS